MKNAALLILALLLAVRLCASDDDRPEASLAPRQELLLGDGWKGMLCGPASTAGTGADLVPREARAGHDDGDWSALSVPHNWEDYQGVAGRKHGNLHGSAWYRNRFTVPADLKGRRVFIFFEGVGSFAEVWVNGRPAGSHAGGLTSFSLDITSLLSGSGDNVLAVRASHPEGIRELPWVCGGCERAYGFSEGSQPFGIHRAVRIIITDTVRVAPFGVHVWNDGTASRDSATARLTVEVANHGPAARGVRVRNTLLAPGGGVLASSEGLMDLPGATEEGAAPVAGLSAELTSSPALLWHPETPHLHTLRTELLDPESGRLLDATETRFGFRTVRWPDRATGGPLLINGRPFFLNGTCEYQHNLGGSHAFSPAMVSARVAQMRAAGFNSFRDAHHPHDLRYNAAWDRHGMPWWTQFGAHAWFDNPAFRTNFKTLLREWVRERRNSPSLILWGLQNESLLPEDFARECTELIRSLDPTSPSQRLVTTCNGGKGADWDVPQNWTGTYGGDPALYGADLVRQILVGEYGAWRSLGLHDEAPLSQSSGYTEGDFNRLLGLKARLARGVADRSVGHFQWIFSTHENPGRNTGPRGEQSADGWAPSERVGPANNKGLLSLWGEPTDTWYQYRAAEIPAEAEPMLVIEGSTWPDRWPLPGVPRTLVVHTNCDEVVLYNDLGGEPLARASRPPGGGPLHFQGVAPRWRVLHATGLRGGRIVASDTILLHHLPEAPLRAAALAAAPDSLPVHPGHASVLRVNCGGPALVDSRGRRWEADRDWTPDSDWGLLSWGSRFAGLDPAHGSIRRVGTPVTGTRDEALYQTFRYGRGALALRARVPDGEYLADLHFAEPWYGRGNVNARGWRLFDVAVNGQTRLRDLDLFSEAGHGAALVRTLPVSVRGGLLEISFPRVAAYQAVLCAVELHRRHSGPGEPAAPAAAPRAAGLYPRADTGMPLYTGAPGSIHGLPGVLHHSLALLPGSANQAPAPGPLVEDSDLFLALPETAARAGLPSQVSKIWTPMAERLQASLPEDPSSGAPARTLDFALFRRHLAAGAKAAELGTLPAGSLLFIRPVLRPAEAQSLRLVSVAGSRDGGAWKAFGRLQTGARPHGASGGLLTRLPQELSDADWLTSPETEPGHDSKGAPLAVTLRLLDHVEVFVALFPGVPPPDWLDGFTLHTGKASLGNSPLTLYRKRFSQGDTLVLGAQPPLSDGTQAPQYAVFARLARPLNRLELAAADFAPAAGQAGHPETMDRPQGLLEPGDALTWRFEVGVGDRYFLVPGLQLAHPATLRVQLLDGDGGVLCDSTHELSPQERPGSLRVRTCSSINAGSYQACLTLLSGAPLRVLSLTIE